MIGSMMLRAFSARAAKAGTVLLSLALAGCFASDDATVTGAVPGASGAAALVRQPTLLVATTRRPADNPDERPWFSAERGRGLAFAEARLQAPDRSLIGRVAAVVNGDWSVLSVGPAKEAGAAEAFAEAAIGRDVLLYVHGYRESFESAALSAARLSEGVRFSGATGLFTWPSGGGTFDYVHDRESAMWSRDALEDLLTALARSPSGGRVHVMAHSMGTLLTLETLRMLRASGGEAAMARIGAVVLASPDVDIDLFVRGVERLGPDARKITVITSTKDRALGLSARIAGGVRAGAAERDRFAKLETLGVRIADASDYGGGLLNHDLFLSNDEVREVVRRAIERAG
jgi:esterase/lipase superfamily enzyme